jgi:transcriptional regulator with XRE-family HTH domain
LSTFSPWKLRRARRDRRPEQVAVAINRSVESLRLYERGSVIPSIPVLTRLAECYGVDVFDFFE